MDTIAILALSRQNVFLISLPRPKYYSAQALETRQLSMFKTHLLETFIIIKLYRYHYKVVSSNQDAVFRSTLKSKSTKKKKEIRR